MNRRDFLKLASFAGLAIAGPGIMPRPAYAAAEYNGPFWVLVNASGGWDPTSLCDPKGRRDELDTDPMNNYFADDIGQAGNLRYAPVGGIPAFFEKYHRRLCIINAVDTETNGHDSGSRHTWSGRLAEGHPSFGALVAGSTAYNLPMAFFSGGGYDYTAGLVAPTRVGNIDAVTRLAFPNHMDAGNPESGLYHTQATWDRIVTAQNDRLAMIGDTTTLPSERHAVGLLQAARLGDNELRRLTEFLPSDLDGSNNPLRRQAQLAVAAYRSGITAVANLNIGGFDTHGNHDQSHIPRMTQLLEGIDFLVEEAERQDVANDMIVVVGSDFGRTPGYNDGNGKDHWSITSMMVMGRGVPGNTVIGATDERHRPHNIDPATLQVVTDGGGIRIKPGHVHRALRKLGGLDTNPIAQMYPIGDEDLPLFG